MKPLFIASFGLIALFILEAPAQSVADLRGTWSGDWTLESGKRDRVTVEFRRDDDAITGRLLNPSQLELTIVEFDESAGKIEARAVDPEDSTHYVLDVVFEDEVTRMTGMMTAGSDSGEVKLVKWTYVPRLR